MKSSLRLLGAAVFLLITWHMVAILLDTRVLPVPAAAFQAFLQMAGGKLAVHFQASTYRVLASLFLALLIGVPLGLLLGRSRSLDQFAAPIIYLTYPIPKIVFLPIILIFLGIGDSSKIFLISLIISYQILVTTRDAARGVDERSILSIKSLGAGTFGVYRHVILPACLPDILTALRISMGTAIAVLFLAESFATIEGLGYVIMDSWGRANYDEMFAGIISMGLLGFTLIMLVDLAESYFCRWRHY